MELFCQLWNASSRPIENTPKIILLHGMGGTGALWRPLAAALENEMAILAPDQRGHGKSRILTIPGSRSGGFGTGYTPLEYGGDLIDTLEAKSKSMSPFENDATNNTIPTSHSILQNDSSGWKSVWILGHSMGVRTAVAAAHLKPDWVKGLVLVDLGFSGAAGGGLGENLALFLRELPIEFATREAARTFMSTHCPDPSISQYLMAVSTRDSEGRISFPFDHSALIQTIEAARDSSVKTWIRELAIRGMPIHVLRGASSLVWSHEEFEKEKTDFREYPSVEFQEIAGAGHGLPFEQRALLAQLLRKWIGSEVC